MGVPGSGKSTFAKQLIPYGYVRVNQDDLGNRKKCERVAKQALDQGKSVVVDRCNFDFPQRKTWINMAYEYNTTLRYIR